MSNDKEVKEIQALLRIIGDINPSDDDISPIPVEADSPEIGQKIVEAVENVLRNEGRLLFCLKYEDGQLHLQRK